MKIYHNIVMAISMYSKIPTPKVEWKKENMVYSMVFFPVVGLVIGAILYGWLQLERVFQIPIYISRAMCVVIPLLVTGGIHFDGWLDTIDARSSYKDRNDKLVILQDSHVGAFAVIGGGIYLLLSYGSFLSLEPKYVWCISLSYILSRACSSIGVALIPLAKKEGFLATFANEINKKVTVIVMLILLIVSGVGMVFLSGYVGILSLVAIGGSFWYYYIMANREFGGITGDLAGYFVELAELMVLLVVAVGGSILGG